MTPRIRLEGLTARYPGFALGPVTLELAAGECWPCWGRAAAEKAPWPGPRCSYWSPPPPRAGGYGWTGRI